MHWPITDRSSSEDDAPHGRFARRLLPAIGKVMLLALGALTALIGMSTVSISRPIDFLAFYGAAQRASAGLSPFGPYATAYGYSVFQSPLWLAWLFGPLAKMPVERAWPLFVVINIGLLALCLALINRLHNAHPTPLVSAYVFSCTLGFSYLLIRFGQVTAIQLLVVVLIILALQSHRPVIAGLLVPMALIKPHLLIFFLPFACLRGGRKMLLSALVSTLALAGLAFWLYPAWLHDLIDTFMAGQRASDMAVWKFMTLTGLARLPVWSGLLVPFLSLPGILWCESKFRFMPTSAWLSVALALSLATSPYAFAYDLPLLLPALLWLSSPWSWWTAPVWLIVAIITLISDFSSVAYLCPLLVCALAVGRALRERRSSPASLPYPL